MSMFGLDGTEITGLVRALADPERGSVPELFARASWTGIAEPGGHFDRCDFIGIFKGTELQNVGRNIHILYSTIPGG